MYLSDANLELLRQRPRQTKLDLFVFQPRTVLQCRINDVSIAKGERVITFDTVSFGSYLSVEPNMTLLIGTTLGGRDVGRIRIKSITSTQITVSENSNIRWANLLYLTVIRYWEIAPIFPRIIPNPSNSTDVIFYKDYDTAYTNQNSILGTFVNAGSHRPVLLENGTGTTYYSSTGTYNLLGEALTYDWAFEGAVVTGSNSAEPGYIAYNTAGDYVTRLRTTSVSGAIDTTYRYVSVRNKIGEGSNTPVVRWNMSGLSGSRGESGYSAEFTVYDDISIQDNSIVMLLADDWYGDTHTSLGGNYPNTSNIFFVGYIESGSIKFDYKKSSYTFKASSVTEIMKKITGFSISVESKASPSKWFELYDMDCRRAMYHYLKWHSTVLNVNDFNFKGTDYKIQYFDADRGSLFNAIDNFLSNTLVGGLSSDRQGRLWAEVYPRAYSNPTGSFPSVMEITNRDWMGEPDITERHNEETSYIEMGGVAYSGVATGTYSALLADAPGGVPSFQGEVKNYPGLALQSQSQLNSLVGNIYANENSKYPTITWDMATNPRNLDIAPMETVSVNINSSDTVRGIGINGLYVPISFSWSYNSEKQTLTANMSAQSLVNGQSGDTITIPPPTEDGGFSSGFGNSSLQIPPISPLLSTSTPTYTWVISYPAVGGIPGPRLPIGHTAMRVDAYVVGGTSATFNIEIRTNPTIAGMNMLSSELVATATPVTAVPSIAALPDGSWLWVDISAAAGANTKLVITLATI